MNKKQLPACMLAALLSGMPLAACADTGHAGDTMSEEEGYQTPIEPTMPEVTVPTAPPEEGEREETPHPPTVSEPEEEERGNTPTVSEVTPPQEEPPAPEENRAQYLRIQASEVNVRAGMGTGFSILGRAERGTLLRYVGKKSGWYETRYRGKTAYVSASYAEVIGMEAGNEKTERVIEEGLNRLGVPYVYGATRLHDGKGNLLRGFTAEEFDCSSLMQYIFYRGANVLLNVTTRTQISQGKAVKKAELKRGDLLFFTNASRKNNTGIERVGHVALYLGDNYILHTASDYAKVEQISSLRWSYFISARRVL